MRRPLSLTKALAVSFAVTWLMWNLLTVQLTLELAAIKDPWQPWLTVVRVAFPLMHFGASFIPSWLALLAYVAFPAAFMAFAAWLAAEDWTFRHGAIAGGVWAVAVALAGFLSPPDQQVNRLYHLARFELGEALAYLMVSGVVAFILVAVVLNAAAVFGARFLRRWGARVRLGAPHAHTPASEEAAMPEMSATAPETAEEG